MQKLRFVNGNGVELDLTSGHYGITNWSGFSNADLTIQGQQVPFQDGEVFLDALYNPRELSVTLAINDNNNLALRYELKRELISVMNAKLGEGYLYYKNDYLERRIKVIPQLPVFENKNSNDSGTLKASLSWTAPEVYWEDVEETMVSLKSFEEKSIVNNGDVPCAVKIEVVTGNTPGYSIQNDDKILSLQEIQDYDRLKINTELGQKNVSGGDFIYNYNKARVLFSETASCPDFTLCVCDRGVVIKILNNGDFKTVYTGTTEDLHSICYSEDLNIFVIVGNRNTILTSTDGETWNQRTSPVNEDLNEVFYSVDKGIYIITGNNGTILTSTDGETWNQRTSPVVTHLNSATFNLECNIFAIVGEGQVVLTSEDAITWNKLQVFDTSKSFVKIKYFPECSPTTWIVGEGGTVYTTSDFVVFGKKDVYINEWYNDVIYSNTDDKLILCGNNGLIAQYSANFKNNIVNKLSFNSNMNFILTPGENTLFVYNVSHPVYSTLTYRQRYIGV